jgi:hypothetical protein
MVSWRMPVLIRFPTLRPRESSIPALASRNLPMRTAAQSMLERNLPSNELLFRVHRSKEPAVSFLHGFCHSWYPRLSTQVVAGAAYPLRRHSHQSICRLVEVIAGYRLGAGWHQTTTAQITNPNAMSISVQVSACRQQRLYQAPSDNPKDLLFQAHSEFGSLGLLSASCLIITPVLVEIYGFGKCRTENRTTGIKGDP